MRRNRSRALLLAALCALTVVAYSPGLEGPFVFDDYPNILSNPLVALERLGVEELRDAAFSQVNRPYPHRGLARLSFALNHYFAGGFDRVAFKATNLAVHVLNGLLVYCLSVLLLRRFAGGARSSFAEAGWSAMQGYLPLMVTAVWLLHPIQLTSVLYVVQRMTSLAALFVFLGLVVFVVGRIRVEAGKAQGWSLMLVGLGGGVVLGFLCKQNAVLLPFYAFLVELFFFRRETLTEASRRRLRAFYAVTVGLPVLVGLAGLVFAWDAIAEGYLHRSFTPYERVLTQSRVLFFYLGLIFFPHIRSFGLYHDDIAPSTGLLEPWTTLVALVLWAVLAGLSLWGVRRRWVWSFGLLWYLVGHALESSVVGLELVFEHRNYVPSFGVLFAATFYVAWGLERLSAAKRLAYPLVAVIIGVLAFTTFTRAGIWASDETLAHFTAQNHPESYRAAKARASLEKRSTGDVKRVYHAYQKSAAARPHTVTALVEMAKIVAGLLDVVGEDGDGNAAPAGPVAIFEEPLRLERSYLRALDAALDREIRRRLSEHPIGPETVDALAALRDCIARRVDVCLPMTARLERWHRIAKQNPRVLTEDKAMLLLATGKLYALMNDPDEALRHMRAAVRTDPRNVSYRMALAKQLMDYRRFDEAQAVIDEFEARTSWSGFGSRQVRWLRERLEAAKRARNESRG